MLSGLHQAQCGFNAVVGYLCMQLEQDLHQANRALASPHCFACWPLQVACCWMHPWEESAMHGYKGLLKAQALYWLCQKDSGLPRCVGLDVIHNLSSNPPA